MGVIPSSINVPLLLANIIRSQYMGSDVSDETMPYKGIWLMTKKIRRVSCERRHPNQHVIYRQPAKRSPSQGS